MRQRRQRGLKVALFVLLGPPILFALHDAFRHFQMRACSANFFALMEEADSALSASLAGTHADDPCAAPSVAEIIACLIDSRSGSRNPRDLGQPAYTTREPQSCQVQLVADEAPAAPGTEDPPLLADGSNSIDFRILFSPEGSAIYSSRERAENEASNTRPR